MIGLPAFKTPAFLARATKLAVAVALPLVPLSTVHGQAEDPVLARQLIMQDLDHEAEILGSIAARVTPPTDMAKHAAQIAKDAKEAYDSFKQNAPGGNAKPEIWTNWADYSKRMEAFVANSAKMAEVAKSGDVNAVTELMVDAMPCKSCHDEYRTKKKS
jgi:cytochrome c556